MFKELAPSGDIDFLFSYTFKNVHEKYATALIKQSNEVSQALQQAVTSANISSDTPIFETQANAFRSLLSQKIAIQVTLNSADLFPLVQSQLAEHYLTPQTVTIETLQDKQLQDAIYGYLRPLLRTAAEEKRATSGTQNSGGEDGVNVKMGGDVKFVNFEIDKSDKDTISHTTGVTFEKSTTDQSYTPHDIKVYKLSSITDQETVDVVTRAFFAQGGDPNFERDTNVKSDFTDEKVGSFKNGAEPAEFDTVLPGMSFCYFGKDVPKGYVELEDKNVWPDAAWVPDPLRGKAMPDTQDLLVGGTHRAEEVGVVYNSGKIEIGPINVLAAGLTVTPNWADPTHFVLISPKSAGVPLKNADDITLSSGVQAKLGVENSVVGGYANTSPNQLSLASLAASPPHIRCRLIVKL